MKHSKSYLQAKGKSIKMGGKIFFHSKRERNSGRSEEIGQNTNVRVMRSLVIFSQIASMVAIVMGLLVIFGWLFNVSVLKSMYTEFVAMKMNTAVCILFAGVSLFLFHQPGGKGTLRSFARLLSWLVVSIGLLTILEYLFDINLGIDQLLVHETDGTAETYSPGRMALNTAVCLMLAGLSLVMTDAKTKYENLISQVLALILVFMSLIPLIGYVYGISDLYQYAQFTSIAWHTAATFFILALGIFFFRPDAAVISVFFKKNLGSYIVRSLFPLLVLLPLVLIWFRIAAERTGFYSSLFGLQLISSLIISIFVFLIWKVAKSVNLLESNLRKSANDLRLVNERFSLAARAAKFGVWDWDVEKNHMVWDDRMYELYDINKNDGLRVDEAWFSGLHPEDRLQQEQLIIKVLAGEIVYDTEFRVVWPDGCVRNLKTFGQVVRDEKGKTRRMTGISFDITEYKETEKNLLLSEKKYKYLFESNPQPMWIFDANTLAFMEVNKSAVRHYGYTREEFLNMNILDIRPPEDVEAVISVTNTVKVENHPGVWRHIKKNGEIIFVEIKAHLIDYEDRPARLVLANDVTERKKADEEIRNWNSELEQRVAERTRQLSESNKELESFAYSVSHDLRAPLRHVIGFSEKLERTLGEKSDHEVDRLTGKIKKSASKMGQLIDELLTYSRLGRTDLKKSLVLLAAIVDDVVKDLSDLPGFDDIEWEIQWLPEVVADATLIKLVFQNLINNAIKFTNKKDKPAIEISCKETSENEFTFMVKDNGAGFNMDYAGKLFGVFQRLHTTEEFEGTGIGLAIVRRIVSRHGGRVWAEGKENVGAAFYFSLPKIKPKNV